MNQMFTCGQVPKVHISRNERRTVEKRELTAPTVYALNHLRYSFFAGWIYSALERR